MASTSNIYGMGTRQEHPGREDDATDPKQAYPASKLAAEKVLRESGLNWVIQRFSFVYGDKDGHLESLPGLATKFNLHLAVRMSMIHHRDIATAMKLALSGVMDKRIVNITDDAPTSLYELAELVGEPMAPSTEPLVSPWDFHADGSLARRLGFRPDVRTVYQAVQENLLEYTCAGWLSCRPFPSLLWGVTGKFDNRWCERMRICFKRETGMFAIRPADCLVKQTRWSGA